MAIGIRTGAGANRVEELNIRFILKEFGAERAAYRLQWIREPHLLGASLPRVVVRALQTLGRSASTLIPARKQTSLSLAEHILWLPQHGTAGPNGTATQICSPAGTNGQWFLGIRGGRWISYLLGRSTMSDLSFVQRAP